jgi:hypothetical protein
MKIINLEKLDTNKTIVLTGRTENVRAIAKHLQAKLYFLPREEDHFTDYPSIINEFQEHLKHEKDTIIVTTQSKEFLDCLLESELDFAQVTVRKYDHDDNDTYRIRVLAKEEACANRRVFNMELRI